MHVGWTHTVADGEFVGWTVSYMNGRILYTVQDSALRLWKKLKTTPLLLIVQFTILTTEKTFTRHLPALCDNSVLTPALTTDVYRQYTAACALFTAAAIRRVLCPNSHTHFLYITAPSVAAKLSWTFTGRTDRWLIAMFPKYFCPRKLLAFEK